MPRHPILVLAISLIATTGIGCGETLYLEPDSGMERLTPNITGNVYKMMNVTMTGNRMNDCSSPFAWVGQVVNGGGPGVRVCISVEGEFDCEDPLNWSRVSRASGWTYDVDSDTWSRVDYLSKAPWSKPGLFELRVRSTDGQVERTIPFGVASTDGDSCR